MKKMKSHDVHLASSGAISHLTSEEGVAGPTGVALRMSFTSAWTDLCMWCRPLQCL